MSSEITISDNNSVTEVKQPSTFTRYTLPPDGLTYSKYLQLDQLLKCQQPVSQQLDKLVHDEHLFIVTHQAFELWFKQIIFEIDSIKAIFSAEVVSESLMLEIVRRTRRISMILKMLVEQITILETMTPLDFMDFRDYLAPGSGFQSMQFRLLEIKWGVKPEDRIGHNKKKYLKVFENEQETTKRLLHAEQDTNMSDVVQEWLSRTPGIDSDGFNFWQLYRNAVSQLLEKERKSLKATGYIDADESVKASLDRRKEMYDSVLDEETHEILRSRGMRRFKHKALKGAMLISIYRHEPRFALPYEFLSLLMDIDSFITKWRYNHLMLVQRMLGSQQMGTGGSSGYQYLRGTLSDRYKVFLDLFNLSSFLIPRHMLPPMSEELKHLLSVGVACYTSSGEEDTKKDTSTSEDNKGTSSLDSSTDASL